MIRRFLERRPPEPPAVPQGRRVYAIGDVHGRLDLLDILLARLEADTAARGAADTDVILLGDLIDRGPESSRVVERAMTSLGWARLLVLKGNHEDAMLAALDGDRDMCRLWLRNGGPEALASWGVAPAVIADGTLGEVIEAARSAIPPHQFAFLSQAPHSIRIGDYYFVHAGVRPGVGLADQQPGDSLWIRDEFLRSTADHGAVVVHGHSITPEVEERANRIGLDTGAYATGRLTALGLEGTDRWLIQTGAAPDSG